MIQLKEKIGGKEEYFQCISARLVPQATWLHSAEKQVPRAGKPRNRTTTASTYTVRGTK